MELGFQVSSLKPLLKSEEQVSEAFRKLKQIGYRHLQIQWISRDVADKAVARALEESKLRCIAMQDFYEDVAAGPERYLAQSRLWGSRYMTVSRIPPEYFSQEGLERFAAKLCDLAERFKAAGTALTFHPVSADYAPVDGICAVDRLMALLPEHIQLTICLYHAVRAGKDPVELLRRYAGRVDLVHFKNAAVFSDGTEALVPIGQGSIHWPPILRACQETGVKWGFAEQESWQKDPFLCAQESFQYLTTHWNP